MKRQNLLFILLATNLSFALAQEDLLKASPTNGALKVFLDCSSCYEDFIKTEITFVNYVRERQGAEVHILITRATMGNGGSSYIVSFLGQQNFAGLEDILRVDTKPDDTDENIRQALVKTLKMGLVRYVAKTDLADQISIAFMPAKTEGRVAGDPWNRWVFTTNIDSRLNGEQLQKSLFLRGSFSADRVTEQWKTSFGLRQSYNGQSFKIGDAKIKSISKDREGSAFLAKSLTDHWSAGFIGEIRSSTYNNIELGWKITPAVEYDVFPYSEFTRRELRLQYGLKRESYRYIAETVFNKTKEDLWSEGLEVILGLKQKWGSVSIDLGGSHYFHDFKKNALVLSTNLSLRLFKGFSLRISGQAARIHDQLSLPKSGATTEEILLQQKQLATQYNYSSSMGLSYVFGSVDNSIINPRFGN